MTARRIEMIGEATLYLGDAQTVMAGLDPVDHVITDPPYESHMHKAKGRRRKRPLRADGQADPAPLDFASIDGMRGWLAEECVRLSAGWSLIFCTPEGVAAWRDALEAAGARYKRRCVWRKLGAMPQMNGQGPAMAVEDFVCAWCGPGHSRWNAGGRDNVFTHPCNPPERTHLHPTEKPISLMRELVDCFTDPGQAVLDPCMGIGSTGVACAQMGRQFLGVEIDEKYFDVACRRIEAAYAQPRLDLPAPPKPKQQMLEMEG